MSTPVLLAVATLLSAVGAAIGALATSRATAGKTVIEAKGLAAKLPAEVDSVVVQGAEAAVITMAKALESANARIDELTAARARDAEERAKDRARMAELEAQVDDLRTKVDHAEAALKMAREAGETLTAQLKQLTAEQDNRHS